MTTSDATEKKLPSIVTITICLFLGVPAGAEIYNLTLLPAEM